MKPKVRNHFTSLCSLYIKNLYPADFKILRQLAEDNYSEGYRFNTLGTVWRKFQIQRPAIENQENE